MLKRLEGSTKEIRWTPEEESTLSGQDSKDVTTVFESIFLISDFGSHPTSVERLQTYFNIWDAPTSDEVKSH